MVVVGRFGRAHGVSGWLRLESFTEPGDNIFSYSGWRVARPASGWEPVSVDAWRANGAQLLVKIVGIDSREQNFSLRGREIALERTQLPEPAADEYYLCDLPGCAVLDASDERVLGHVQAVRASKPQDLLEVRRPDGKVRLLPVLPEVVIARVDIAASQIWVHKEATLL